MHNPSVLAARQGATGGHSAADQVAQERFGGLRTTLDQESCG
jgi:hypothetical protein